MYEKIDIKEFYSGLDLLFKQKNATETKRYMEDWLKRAQQMNDTSGIVAGQCWRVLKIWDWQRQSITLRR